MKKRSTLFPRLRSIQQFQGDSKSPSSSSSDEEQAAAASSQEKSVAVRPSVQEASIHLFHVALLEHVCRMYEPDTTRSKRLFSELCERLSRLRIMNPVTNLDELQDVRSQYTLFFSNLLHKAMNEVNKPQNMAHRLEVIMQPRLPALTPSDSGWRDYIRISRYADDFIELDRLGSGAYGSVHRATHSLDKKDYAVKKVAFEGDNKEMLEKILREVRLLADFSHRHIVRYYTAWLEPQSVTLHVYNRLKAITEGGSISGLNASGGSGDSHGSSIVFEEKASKENGEERRSPPAATTFSSHIVPCLLLHIQMELCNLTLSEWLEERNKTRKNHADFGAVDEKQNERILKHLLQALSEIHSKDLIHRDVKPKNIFLSFDADGSFHVKLGDFGLTRTLKSAADSPLTPHPGFHWPTSDTSPTPIVREIYSPEKDNTETSTSKSRQDKNGVVTDVQLESTLSTTESSLIRNTSGTRTIQHSIRYQTRDVSFTATSSTVNGTDDSIVFEEDSGKESKDRESSQSQCVGSSVSSGQGTSEAELEECPSLSGACPDVIYDRESYTSGVGTTNYAAPEQLTSTTYDDKADMYSVGVVLYELYQPFNTNMERCKSIDKLRKVELDQSFQQKWPGIADIISQLVSTRPRDRPSAQALLDGELFDTKQQMIHRLTSYNNALRMKIRELEERLKQKDEEMEQMKKKEEEREKQLQQKDG